jgi:acyl-coenzyme A synthetase/AMP-(fatty) acid ligase
MNPSPAVRAVGLAQCEGSPIDRTALPISIGAFLAALVDHAPGGEITAVSLSGEARRWTFSMLWRQAWGGLLQLHQRGYQPGQPVRPAARELGDRIAQAWACFLGGYPVVIAPLDCPAEGLPAGCVTWEGSPPAADPGILPAVMASEAIAAYLPTSGTTGQARFACLSERALRSRFCDQFSGFGDRQRDGQDPSAAHLVLFPWHSVSGMSVFFPRAPRTFCVDPQLLLASPSRLYGLMTQARISYLALSSSFAALLNEGLRSTAQRWDLSALRRIGVGAEPVMPAVFRELRERLTRYGATPVMLAGYGMTETGLLCAMKPDTALANTWLLGEAPVCLGGPTPGWRLRVVDDLDRHLAPGEEGHLQVDSLDKGFSGYLGDDGKPLNTFSADGWFRTGDLGVIHDGQVTVTGRNKEILIIHGVKYPRERIEHLLRDLPGVSRGQVYACSVRGGESITDELGIAYVPAVGLPEDQRLQTAKAIRQRLAEQMRLAVRVLLPLRASELPRTPTGKVRRTELAQRMRKAQGQPGG